MTNPTQADRNVALASTGLRNWEDACIIHGERFMYQLTQYFADHAAQARAEGFEAGQKAPPVSAQSRKDRAMDYEKIWLECYNAGMAVITAPVDCIEAALDRNELADAAAVAVLRSHFEPTGDVGKLANRIHEIGDIIPCVPNRGVC